jgi:hypothetical protein
MAALTTLVAMTWVLSTAAGPQQQQARLTGAKGDTMGNTVTQSFSAGRQRDGLRAPVISAQAVARNVTWDRG